jgi:hypothetical protein
LDPSFRADLGRAEDLISRIMTPPLNLDRTGVTNAGLAHLKGMKELDELVLTNTKVTDAGVAKLQAALPKCTIRQ